MSRSTVFLSGIALVLLLFCESSNIRAGSQDEVSPLQIQLEPFLSGLTGPLYITAAGDGSDRLFVVEQVGRIKVVQPGSTTPAVFLDIRSRVLSGGER